MYYQYVVNFDYKSCLRRIKVGTSASAKFQVSDHDFVKSSWSKNNPKTCVMVAMKPDGVALRDSKDATKNTLFFNHDEWKSFVSGVKSGEFDSVS